MRTEILRMENIKKSRSGIKVLDYFSMNVYKGEVLGVLGLSGTGKTAISNILAGFENIEDGKIYFKEELVSHLNRNISNNIKIFTIHHTVRLVPQLSIAENIYVIKNNSYKKILVNQRAINHQTRLLLKEIGLDISPQTIASELTLAEQHLIELAKAIAFRAVLIILDDIAESYTIREMDKLKEAIEKIRNKGVAFIYESQKPDEVINIADRITILRDGRNTKTFHKDEYNKNIMINLMVGSEFKESFKRENTITEETILKMNKICTNKIENLSFDLRKGEILGILDLENKASIEVYNLLSGGVQPISGELYLSGEKLTINSISKAIKSGIGLMPENAVNNTLFQNMTYAENLSFMIMKKMSGPLMSLSKRIFSFIAREYRQLLDIDEDDEKEMLKSFNLYTRQKVMLTRWMLYNPKVLVCANPGAMLDIITKEISFSFINEFAKKGVGILLVTSDFQEATSICDRIIVISDKKIKGEYNRDTMIKLNMESLY